MKTLFRFFLGQWILVASLLFPHARGEGFWPQWRGPDRSNRSSETGLLTNWPAEGPPLLWQTSGLGEGIASVSIAGGTVYTVGYLEDREFVFALKEETGESRWISNVGFAVEEGALMRWLSQRTPTVDGDRLYTVTARGDLFCLRTSDGQTLWTKSYRQEFGSQRPRWGFADRPLVDAEKLICVPAGTNGAIVALNKRTGEVLWKTHLADDEREAYAATILAESAGVRQYLVFLHRGLYSVSPADGRVLWRYSGTAARLGSSYTPLIHDDFVFTANGYHGGMALLKILRDGARLTPQERYRHEFDFSPFQESTVLLGNHFYSFKSPGMAICVDIQTGKLVWGPEGTAKDRAALTYAEGHLYVRRASGRMVLQKATPEAYVEISSFQIPDPEEASGATAPVVAGKRLYLRDNSRLLCYNIAADAFKTVKVSVRTNDLLFAEAARTSGIKGPSSDPAGANPSAGIFVPTPADVVTRMLEMAGLKKDDVLFDLGSGDGRILLAAARTYGSKAVGYEIDPELVTLSREAIRAAGLEDLVSIEASDLFEADLAAADVVALYLPSRHLARLVPQLNKLKPGARVISHQFRIPGVPPERVTTIVSQEDGEPHRLYLWTAPIIKDKPARESRSTGRLKFQ